MKINNGYMRPGRLVMISLVASAAAFFAGCAGTPFEIPNTPFAALGPTTFASLGAPKAFADPSMAGIYYAGPLNPKDDFPIFGTPNLDFDYVLKLNKNGTFEALAVVNGTVLSKSGSWGSFDEKNGGFVRTDTLVFIVPKGESIVYEGVARTDYGMDLRRYTVKTAPLKDVFWKGEVLWRQEHFMLGDKTRRMYRVECDERTSASEIPAILRRRMEAKAIEQAKKEREIKDGLNLFQ